MAPWHQEFKTERTMWQVRDGLKVPLLVEVNGGPSTILGDENVDSTLGYSLGEEEAMHDAR